MQLNANRFGGATSCRFRRRALPSSGDPFASFNIAAGGFSLPRAKRIRYQFLRDLGKVKDSEFCDTWVTFREGPLSEWISGFFTGAKRRTN